MSKLRVMLGAGGHAAVLLDILSEQGKAVDYIVSLDVPEREYAFSNLKSLSSDKDVLNISPSECILVNGVGSIPSNTARFDVFEFFKSRGYSFESIVAASAIISKWCDIKEGVQILHGAIIQAGSKIENNSIINTGAQIDHDCVIGAHNHVAPGATLSGSVSTGVNVHIGTGASVIQCVNIGKNSVVGVGAVVGKSIGSNSVIYGYRD